MGDVENPREELEKRMYSVNLTVWCRFWSRRFIGRYLNEAGFVVTLKEARVSSTWVSNKKACCHRLQHNILKKIFGHHTIREELNHCIIFCEAFRRKVSSNIWSFRVNTFKTLGELNAMLWCYRKFLKKNISMPPKKPVQSRMNFYSLLTATY